MTGVFSLSSWCCSPSEARIWLSVNPSFSFDSAGPCPSSSSALLLDAAAIASTSASPTSSIMAEEEATEEAKEPDLPTSSSFLGLAKGDFSIGGEDMTTLSAAVSSAMASPPWPFFT